MNPTPPGWPRCSSSLFYDDAAAAIDFLERAFGFSTRLRVEGEGGSIEHSELTYGDAVVMVASAGRHTFGASPRGLGGKNTQSLFLYVDDLDAHLAQARAAGAVIHMEPKVSDYGEDYWTDRTYAAMDVEGHNWWFAQRLRNPR